MDRYQFTQAAREVATLVDELSNWYVRRSRNRFWASGLSEDKRAAYSMLYETLTTICRLLAPFVPYVTEDIHQKLKQTSVHLEDYPKAYESMINLDLETNMKTILKIVELGRSIRNAKSLKVKQPLQQLVVWRKEEKQVLKPYSGIIKDELNVKEIIYTENVSHYQSTFFKLNFKTAGAAFAKLINAVKEYVDHISDTDKKLLLENEQLQINIQGQTVTIEKKHLHVEYQVASGFEMAGDEQLKVILDITLTPQLVDEGQVRELIRVIQDTRKKLDLPIEKYISIKISTIDNVKGKIRQFEELIKENILVHNITYEKLGNSEKHFEVTFDNEIVKVSLIY